jgi:ubiquinone/menaquinone biosynthesis C-methylase UbiE
LRVRTLINKKKVVLDLGAGEGFWFKDKGNIKIRKSIQYLKKDVKKLYAVDIDRSVLKNKSSHKNLIMKKNFIPLKKNSIDIIICDWVFEHIENPTIFYAEINRVLKKGGVLCVRTPHKFSYVSIISDILEGSSFKDFLLKKTQPGKKEYFKSFYRLNTKNKINKIFKYYSKKIFIFTPDPAYYFNFKLFFIFFRLVHFIFPKFFSGILVCFLKK